MIGEPDIRIFFDTEFIEDGHTIDLISIGLVREDGEWVYMQNSECDLTRANKWVYENVVPHLTPAAPDGIDPWYTRMQIAQTIRDFVGEKPEFWAYFADYDWVVLCQLYGRMVDLPKGWPMFCLDVQQAHYTHPEKSMVAAPKITGTAHSALDDAIWCKNVWEWLHAIDR